MVTLRPFAALRPPRDRAAAVAAVPYDVVSTAEARILADGNPWSFLRVSRAELALREGTDPRAEAVYETASAHYDELRRSCPLLVEESPSLYVYRLRMERHEQTGIGACFSLDEYERGQILRHEVTRRDTEDDRTRHMLALRAQTGPVLLAYRDRPSVDELVLRATAREPLYDFTAPDGVSHTVWRAETDAAARLVQEFSAVRAFYIADGHHRAASAARVRRQLDAERPRSQATDEERRHLLGVAFPAGQLRILPYNRIVLELGGQTPEQFLDALRKTLPMIPDATPSPRRRGEVSMYLAGRWHGWNLSGKGGRGGGADLISSLDVSRLQSLVLEPLLGIRDVRSDRRIDFVGGIRGAAELERLVDSGAAAVAFSMHPVSLEELMAVCDAGEIMPPKSTWFEPKLRDGLLIHSI